MSEDIIRKETKNLLQIVKEMVQMTVNQHDKAKKAIANSDKKLALKIIEKDKTIDLKNSEIDSEVAFLITKKPLAIDLRRTLAYYSIAREIERVADYAKHISKFVLEEKEIASSSKTKIRNAHKPFRNMLAKVNETIASENVNKAIELASMDEIVDKVQSKLRKSIISSVTLKNSESAVKQRIFVLSVINALERASDHIVNICEYVAYIKTGSYSALE